MLLTPLETVEGREGLCKVYAHKWVNGWTQRVRSHDLPEQVLARATISPLILATGVVTEFVLHIGHQLLRRDGGERPNGASASLAVLYNWSTSTGSNYTGSLGSGRWRH